MTETDYIVKTLENLYGVSLEEIDSILDRTQRINAVMFIKEDNNGTESD